MLSFGGYELTPAAGSVTVLAALTDLWGTNGLVLGNQVNGRVVNLEVQNNGAGDFTDFRIRLKDHAEGEFYDYLVAADWVSGTNPNVISCSTALDVLAAGAKGHVIFRCHSAYAVNVQAKRTNATSARCVGNLRGA